MTADEVFCLLQGLFPKHAVLVTSSTINHHASAQLSLDLVMWKLRALRSTAAAPCRETGEAEGDTQTANGQK